MKKVFKSIALLVPVVAMLASCSMFKLDNYDGPNAQITGKLMDVVTGEVVSLEAATASSFDWSTWSTVTTVKYGSIVVTELGYIPPTWKGDPADYPVKLTEQDWLVRFDGQYTNTMVFAGTYKYSTKKLPCYEPDADKNTFVLKEGKNVMNLGVLPFCRIKDPKITYNAATKKMVATFYVELGDPSRANKVSNVVFAGNTQLFVGANGMNLAKDDKGAKAKDVNPGELITLEIDTKAAENADLFKYASQDRYFRIAAMAEGNGYNQASDKYYNFSPIFKVSADFSTITEVEWDQVEW